MMAARFQEQSIGWGSIHLFTPLWYNYRKVLHYSFFLFLFSCIIQMLSFQYSILEMPHACSISTRCKNHIILQHPKVSPRKTRRREDVSLHGTFRGCCNLTLPCKATMMNREGKEGNAKPSPDSSQLCRRGEAPTASHHVFFIRLKQPGSMGEMDGAQAHACMPRKTSLGLCNFPGFQCLDGWTVRHPC